MADIVVILTSPRKGANSDTIALKMAEGAEKNGKSVKVYRINDLENKKGCQACMGCKKAAKCVIKDDIGEILEEIRGAEGVIIGVPDYFGQPASQYRMFEDRLYGYLGADFVPNIEAGKKVAVAVTCGGGYDGAVAIANNIEGVFANFLKFQPVGKIVMKEGFAPNVAAENADVMAEALAIGSKF